MGVPCVYYKSWFGNSLIDISLSVLISLEGIKALNASEDDLRVVIKKSNMVMVHHSYNVYRLHVKLNDDQTKMKPRYDLPTDPYFSERTIYVVLKHVSSYQEKW